MDRIRAAEVFITIVEQGSLSGAADKLDMSRAMVTRYLAEMEGWAGARLLHRTTRRLSLTSAGKVIYNEVLKLNNIANRLPLLSQNYSDSPAGSLRISCPHSIAYDELAKALVPFLKQYPKIEIDVRISNQAVNLVEDRIDLAIRITDQLEPQLIAKKLGVCHSVVCASPEYFSDKDLPKVPNDLLVHNCLVYRYFGQNEWCFDYDGQVYAVSVKGQLRSNESTFLTQATSAGAGIAMLPYSSVRNQLKDGSLIQVLPNYQPKPLTVYAVYSSREHMPQALRCLLDHLSDWFKNI
ncbi:LysR family transcriptional regulator [Wohlfahrtiimonas larvae]|uniref:LysR family transcriptional regulator n=1 Tax=Wohlfahrtiimonas larvae TaxID=1157986 RepID=A0ABP9MUC6_9GAMM|nr:LysR family transcriptional regulator [Wohlfahrtiimonas larvae]